MPLKANQHQNFSYEVLPLLFHNEGAQFIVLLRRDGINFLKFWWDRAGINLDESMRVSPEGMDFEIKKVNDGREMVLVKLPPPREAPEAYYLALVTKPKKRSLLPWRNLAKVFALSRDADLDSTGAPNTTLVELTRTARYVPIGKGPRPTLKEFSKVVFGMITKKLSLGWL
jgi:hypothetical protein